MELWAKAGLGEELAGGSQPRQCNPEGHRGPAGRLASASEEGIRELEHRY